MRKVPAPVVSIGCFAARAVFTETVVEKFELKYVRSTRVDELYVRAPVIYRLQPLSPTPPAFDELMNRWIDPGLGSIHI